MKRTTESYLHVHPLYRLDLFPSLKTIFTYTVPRSTTGRTKTNMVVNNAARPGRFLGASQGNPAQLPNVGLQ